MVDIQRIDESSKKVFFKDDTSIDFKGFVECFRDFMRCRIAGETLYPSDMERFMRRTSGKNLSLLMKGKKMEGYMEGVSDKILSRTQKIAIGTIVIIIMVALVVFVILRNQGIINF